MAELVSSCPQADHLTFVTKEVSWTPAMVVVWVRIFLLHSKIGKVSFGNGRVFEPPIVIKCI